MRLGKVLRLLSVLMAKMNRYPAEERRGGLASCILLGGIVWKQLEERSKDASMFLLIRSETHYVAGSLCSLAWLRRTS